MDNFFIQRSTSYLLQLIMHFKKIFIYSCLEKCSLSGVIWHLYILLSSLQNDEFLTFYSLKLVFENITVQNGNVRPMTGHS